MDPAPGHPAGTRPLRTPLEVNSRLQAKVLIRFIPASLYKKIAAYDKEVEQLFLSHADNEIWASLPGAGKRLAPRLLAEIGEERARYEQPTNLHAVAGTSPVLFESGNYSKARRRLACIKPLRNVLYPFAWQSTRQEGWAEEYYRRKRAEGKSQSVALRALSNNWLRIIHALWRKKEKYVSATFAEAQFTHARKAA